MPRTSIAIVLIASLIGTNGCASLRKKEAFQDADYFLREKTVAAVEFSTEFAKMAVYWTGVGFLNGFFDSDDWDSDESFGEQLDKKRSYETYYNSQ